MIMKQTIFLILLIFCNLIIAGEGTGNPDQRLKERRISFNDYLTEDKINEFFDSMELPSNIKAMFALVKANNINHHLADYNLINQQKRDLSEPIGDHENPIYAQAHQEINSIVWYPAGLSRNKEEIFLTYVHELVRLSYTKSNKNRESGLSADLYVNSLDPYFRTLLIEQDNLNERADAKNKLKREMALPYLSLFLSKQLTLHPNRLAHCTFELNGIKKEVQARAYFKDPSTIFKTAESFIEAIEKEEYDIPFRYMQSVMTNNFMHFLEAFLSDKCLNKALKYNWGLSTISPNYYTKDENLIAILWDHKLQRWIVALPKKVRTKTGEYRRSFSISQLYYRRGLMEFLLDEANESLNHRVDSGVFLQSISSNKSGMSFGHFNTEDGAIRIDGGFETPNIYTRMHR